MPQPSTGILDPPLGSFVLTICPTKYSSQRKSINLTARGFGGRTRTSKFLAPPLASLRLPSCLLNSFVHSSPHTILSPLGTRLGGDTVAASAWLFATDSRCQIFSSWRLILSRVSRSSRPGRHIRCSGSLRRIGHYTWRMISGCGGHRACSRRF